jgi:hypothetical protein
MQIRELSKPVTAKQLNESLAKQFGYKLNLEQFSDVQLEDARNKLRTKLSQLELSENYDSINESPDYQKTKIMLDCINTEILEREAIAEGTKDLPGNQEKIDVAEPKGKIDGKDMAALRAKKKKKMESVNLALMVRKAREHSVPTKWIESAISRIKLGETDSQELKSELTTRYDLSENQANYIVYLKEGEQTKAEVIMATKDMVDQITGWYEDVAQLKSEHLLELLDSIREALGSDVASKYEQAVKPALDQIYSSIEQARQGISSGLALVSGGEAPGMMGAEAPTGMPGEEAGMGGEMPPPVPGEAPDMGAEAPALPGPEAGREKRESVDYSRRLGMLLAQSKKN